MKYRDNNTATSAHETNQHQDVLQIWSTSLTVRHSQLRRVGTTIPPIIVIEPDKNFRAILLHQQGNTEH